VVFQYRGKIKIRRGQKKNFFRLRNILIILGIILVAILVKRVADFRRYSRLGQECYSREDIEGAIRNWERATRLNPWSSGLLTKLGFLYMRQKLYEEALAVAQKAVGLSPEYESALVLLGEASFRCGRKKEEAKDFTGAWQLYKKAIESYRKALNFAYAPDTIHYLGAAYLYLGEYDEGIVFFTERMPSNPEAIEERNRLMELKKRFLAGGGPNELAGADTPGPLPEGARIAIVGHPIFKFSQEDTSIFQNGVFYSDLDLDGNPELILLYKIETENQSSLFVSVFEWLENRWKMRWNTRLGGSDFGYFCVEDINADSRPEIVVENIYDFKTGAMLNIYGYMDSSYKILQQLGPTWGTTLLDLDQDGTKEIIILNRKKDEYNSIIYRWNGTKYIPFD